MESLFKSLSLLYHQVEQAWEGLQQERELLEERCSALESELQSISTQHDDEVERMRQDVLTAVSAIRANEEESETQLSDRLQRMTKQIVMQKENFKVRQRCTSMKFQDSFTFFKSISADKQIKQRRGKKFCWLRLIEIKFNCLIKSLSLCSSLRF